jgi:hypothetical protein
LSAIPDDKPQTKYPEYPWEIKDQIKEKRELVRRWQMSRYPGNKRRYNGSSLLNKKEIDILQNFKI